jgi:hypothetical protein
VSACFAKLTVGIHRLHCQGSINISFFILSSWLIYILLFQFVLIIDQYPSFFAVFIPAMHFLPSLVFLPLAVAVPFLHKRDKPIFWVLAGDSTTATKTGWGAGFLNTTVTNGASGDNLGHGGATTASFRAGGDWKNVIEDIGAHKSKYDVWVTIQFGHNDQKNTSGVTLSQYQTNLKKFAAEAKTAGATPVRFYDLHVLPIRA